MREPDRPAFSLGPLCATNASRVRGWIRGPFLRSYTLGGACLLHPVPYGPLRITERGFCGHPAMEGRKGHLHHPRDPPPGFRVLVEPRRPGLVERPGLPSQALGLALHPLEACVDPCPESDPACTQPERTLGLPWGKSQEGGFAISCTGDPRRIRATVRRETWRA